MTAYKHYDKTGNEKEGKKLGEIVAAICVFLWGMVIFTTPNPQETCNALAKNNLTNPVHENSIRCEATIDMERNIKWCDIKSNLGGDFDTCIDESVKGLVHSYYYRDPNSKDFIEALGEQAKKEHKAK